MSALRLPADASCPVISVQTVPSLPWYVDCENKCPIFLLFETVITLPPGNKNKMNSQLHKDK